MLSSQSRSAKELTFPLIVRYAPEKIQYGIDRYQNETRRLYGVYEQQLATGKDFLVGAGKGKYSYADMCTFPWYVIINSSTNPNTVSNSFSAAGSARTRGLECRDRKSVV